MKKAAKLRLSALGCVAVVGLAGCETSGTSTGVYYDSMLWNDYYRGYYRPGYPIDPDRPDRPPKPEHPIERPPEARPPVARPPSGGDPGFSRPTRPSAPIHRPAASGRPGGGGLRR